jgi:hypothetical protein
LLKTDKCNIKELCKKQEQSCDIDIDQCVDDDLVSDTEGRAIHPKNGKTIRGEAQRLKDIITRLEEKKEDVKEDLKETRQKIEEDMKSIEDNTKQALIKLSKTKDLTEEQVQSEITRMQGLLHEDGLKKVLACMEKKE